MTFDPVAGPSKSARVSPVPEIRGIAEATRTSVREPQRSCEDRVRGEAAAAARFDDRQVIEIKDAGFTYDGETFVFEGLDLRREARAVRLPAGRQRVGQVDARQARERPAHARRGKRASCWNATRATRTSTYFIRSNAGMVFQNPDDQLVASLVENDVAFGPENLGVPTSQLRDAREALARRSGTAGIRRARDERAFRRPEAAGGHCRRAGHEVRRSSCSTRRRPCSTRADGRGLLRVCQELHERGMTIVMITHFMEEAALADRVVVLDGGRVRLDGTPEEVLAQGELLESLNLDMPFACRLSLQLQRRGVPVAGLRDRRRAEGGTVPIVFDQVSFTYEDPDRAEKQRRREKKRLRAAQRAARKAATQGQAEAGAGAAPDATAAAPIGGCAPSNPGSVPAPSDPGVSSASSTTDAPLSLLEDVEEKPAWGTAPDAVWALRGIDFTLEDGEFFGIAGHTGSGKSTLIQHMNGLVHPTCGRVLVGGQDLADKKAAQALRGQHRHRVPVSRIPAVRRHGVRRRGVRSPQPGTGRPGSGPARAARSGKRATGLRRAAAPKAPSSFPAASSGASRSRACWP